MRVLGGLVEPCRVGDDLLFSKLVREIAKLFLFLTQRKVDHDGTADAYGGGRSETYIGNWLRGKGSSVREQLLLSSKVFNPVGPGPNDRGLSRRQIFRQVDASLARLGTDRLDLYLIHEPDPETPLEETIRALEDIVRMGKVLYIGASNIEAWRLLHALSMSTRRDFARFDWVQNSYSLLDRAVEREVLPLCADQGLGFTPFSPMAGGWLSGKYRSVGEYPAGSRMTLRPGPYEHLLRDEVFAGLDALGARAKARGVDMPTLALAWVLSHPLVSAIIVGPRKPAHFDPALAALELPLDDAERQELADLFPGL